MSHYPNLKNGSSPHILLEGEILAAQSISKCETEAAVKLGVSFMTYRKYAMMYGLYGRIKNMAGLGISKPIKNEDGGKYPLNKILEGRFPNYSTGRLKVRLIRAKRMEERCDRCGFCEHRISDSSVPLLLNYKDGNNKNKKKENLELLCYNCYYLFVNNPFGPRKRFYVPSKDNPDGPPLIVDIPETSGTSEEEPILTDAEKAELQILAHSSSSLF
jgi:hypothetical protein